MNTHSCAHRGQLVALAVCFSAIAAFTPGVLANPVFEQTIRGTTCKQSVQGKVNCNYVVGRDLEISIASAGDATVGISFLRSNASGDYYARYGPMHGCVIVAEGRATTSKSSSSAEFAFISPKTGRVYRTWPECQAAK